MDRPTRIKVGQADYAIEYVDAEWVNDNDLQGRIDYRKRVISIYEKRPAVEIAETFMHEVVHALLHHYNRIHLDEPIGNEDVSEWLGAGLVMVWRDNPEAFAWWSELIPT